MPKHNDEELIEVRWGDDLFEAGFTQVPHPLLWAYTELGMSNIEAMFIVHLMSFKYGARQPYPSLQTIADRMGMNRRNLRRHVSTIREKGLLTITPRHDPTGRQTSNIYDFAPLFQALRAVARKRAKDDPGEGVKNDLHPSVKNDLPRIRVNKEEDLNSNNTNSKFSKMNHERDDVDNSPKTGELTPIHAVLSVKTKRSVEPQDELEAAVDRASRELGNWRVYRSNRTQTRHIAEEYRVTDTVMAQVIYQALSRTKQESPRNPMAYLFKTARQLLQDRALKQATTDLVGERYAGKVMH